MMKKNSVFLKKKAFKMKESI